MKLLWEMHLKEDERQNKITASVDTVFCLVKIHFSLKVPKKPLNRRVTRLARGLPIDEIKISA